MLISVHINKREILPSYIFAYYYFVRKMIVNSLAQLVNHHMLAECHW